MKSASFTPTYTVPAQGMQLWAAPDGSQAPIAQLVGSMSVTVNEVTGAWANVSCGPLRGWVDGRLLVASAPVQPEQPQPVPVPVATPEPVAAAPVSDVASTPVATAPEPTPVAQPVAAAMPTNAEAMAATPYVPPAMPPRPMATPMTQMPMASAATGASSGAMSFRMLFSVVGVVAAVASVWLAWLSFPGAGSFAVSAFQLPMEVLWGSGNGSIANVTISIGIVVIALSAVGFVGTVYWPLRFLRWIGGLGVAAAGVDVVVQIVTSATNVSFGDLIGSFGLGIYVAVVAGILMLIGKSLPMGRKSTS